MVESPSFAIESLAHKLYKIKHIDKDIIQLMNTHWTPNVADFRNVHVVVVEIRTDEEVDRPVINVSYINRNVSLIFKVRDGT